MGYGTRNCVGTQPFPPYSFTKCFVSCAEVSQLSHSPLGWCWLPLPLTLPRNCSAWLIWVGHFILTAQHPPQASASLCVTGFVLAALPCQLWCKTHRKETVLAKKCKDFTSQTWSLSQKLVELLGVHWTRWCCASPIKRIYIMKFWKISSLLSNMWWHYYHHYHYCRYYLYWFNFL